MWCRLTLRPLLLPDFGVTPPLLLRPSFHRHGIIQAIENYLVQMDGFSWSVAARDASRGFLIR